MGCGCHIFYSYYLSRIRFNFGRYWSSVHLLAFSKGIKYQVSFIFSSAFTWENQLKYFSVLLLAKSIGCFRDTGRRAIATMEGKSRLLTGNYQRRWDAIRKCALAAERRRYRMFALQNGGWCASSRTAYRTYRRYGKSKKCRKGKGGPWANDVYILRG